MMLKTQQIYIQVQHQQLWARHLLLHSPRASLGNAMQKLTPWFHCLQEGDKQHSQSGSAEGLLELHTDRAVAAQSPAGSQHAWSQLQPVQE